MTDDAKDLAVEAARENTRSLRQQASDLVGRLMFSLRSGLSGMFGGRRDFNVLFGFPAVITSQDYIRRYSRDGIARRIVRFFPEEVWIDGISIVESEDPNVKTDFEIAANDFLAQNNVISAMRSADILANRGEYSVLLLGAPAIGGLNTELLRGSSSSQISYLLPLSDQVAQIEARFGDSPDDDPSNPMFWRPKSYIIQPQTAFRQGFTNHQPATAPLAGKSIHWSRCIHIAHDCIDDINLGTPVLEAVWNLLDSLEKIVHGVSEAIFQRADPGMHANIDPAMGKILDEEKKKLEDRHDEYRLGLRKFLLTQGVDVELLSASRIPTIGTDADALMTQICATLGIPKRKFMGTERGDLASTQDQGEANTRSTAYVSFHAKPSLKKLIDRLVDYSYLPKPKSGKYDIVWPVEDELDEDEKPKVVLDLANANKAQRDAGGGFIYTENEIRDKVYGDKPIKQPEPIVPPEAPTVPTVPLAPTTPPEVAP